MPYLLFSVRLKKSANSNFVVRPLYIYNINKPKMFLLKLFNDIFTTGHIPKRFKISFVNPFFRKGSNTEVQSHRPFCPAGPYSYCGRQCLKRSDIILWNISGYKLDSVWFPIWENHDKDVWKLLWSRWLCVRKKPICFCIVSRPHQSVWYYKSQTCAAEF